MKKIYTTIRNFMEETSYCSIAEISAETGIRQIDVLKVINLHKLCFALAVIPLSKERKGSCYYKLVA